MAEPASCALCRRKRDLMVAITGHSFCAGCLAAIGRFVRGGPLTVRHTLWRSAFSKPITSRPVARTADPNPNEAEHFPKEKGQHPFDQLFAELNAREVQEPDEPGTGAWKYSVEEVFAEFKAGLANVAKPADVETHFNLGIAYRDMGLADDALEEAALALEYGAHQLGQRARVAVEILLDPRCLRRSLDETLAILRASLFPE